MSLQLEVPTFCYVLGRLVIHYLMPSAIWWKNTTSGALPDYRLHGVGLTDGGSAGLSLGPNALGTELGRSIG